ncbi:hypothetical protein AAIM60_07085 [Pseudomonas lijiangensis]|uniref:hypothetical protein n=1 Tax=Pseudomonas lijiangensis TaxID=2995658 RepID=UPI0031BA076C
MANQTNNNQLIKKAFFKIQRRNLLKNWFDHFCKAWTVRPAAPMMQASRCTQARQKQQWVAP